MKAESAQSLSPGQARRSDVVIVGSGGGGAVTAYALASAGYSVTVLEAGPMVPSSAFAEHLPSSFEQLYVDRGGQTNVDGDINILQGRCVGGSTVINATAAFRIPSWVLKTWREEHGLDGFTEAALEPLYEQLESDLYIHVNGPHEINRNSQLMQQGAEALGWSVAPLARNVRDCLLAGYCIQGCRYDRKQSMLVTYLPWAQKHGARIISDAPVDRIRHQDGQAIGVSVQGPAGQIDFDAALVIVSAGAIGSPLLLQDSGLGGEQVGRHFACHPSLGVTALFDDPVLGWQGAQLGVYVDEFTADERGGFLLEGGALEPAAMAHVIPGRGQDYETRMARAANMAGMVTLIHDHGVGRVYRKDGVKTIEYRLDDDGRQRVRAALRAAARIWFAAGAQEVYLPTVLPTAVTAADFEAVIDAMRFEPGEMMFSAYHPQGTCRMGRDPDSSVLNPRGQLHGMDNLVVADASCFPTSVLVNTQLPTYVTAARIAAQIKDNPADFGLG